MTGSALAEKPNPRLRRDAFMVLQLVEDDPQGQTVQDEKLCFLTLLNPNGLSQHNQVKCENPSKYFASQFVMF